MTRVQAPVIPIVGEWIAEHPGTISLGQGVVHYSPPAEVAQAVSTAATQPATHRYGMVRGSQELLDLVAAKVTEENGIDVSLDRTIVVTAGANMGFLNAVLSVADVGDEIMLLRPFYFNHEMAVEIAGCRPVIVSTTDDYQPDMQAILAAITPRTRAIVTISPNNPSGVVYSRERLEEVNRLCAERNLYHISDETYEYFLYDGLQHFSPGSAIADDQHTISLYSLSKSYGMPGWRIGYMVIPRHLEIAVKKIQDTNLICPALISQAAAVAAMQAGRGWCRQQMQGFQQVRDIVLEQLARVGDRVRVVCPKGSFYTLIDVGGSTPDLDQVHRLIREFGVAVMPGSTFGMTQSCTFRIAFGALDRDTVAEGMGRLVKGLQSLDD